MPTFDGPPAKNMKIAYFDCFSGASGDMIIGALLDSGLAVDAFRGDIAKLGLAGYELEVSKVTRNHMSATKFTVRVKGSQTARTPHEIADIIAKSGLADEIRKSSTKIFMRLAQAEANVHGEPLEKVHFHEVGGVDALIDICGSVICLKMLGVEKVYSSPLLMGRGQVVTSHGAMPLPAPATFELAKGFPSRITDAEFEYTTPTGASILTTIAEFSNPPVFVPQAIGFGAGSKETVGLPNLLRVSIGEEQSYIEFDQVTLLESNLDRVSAELISRLTEALMWAGALDVYVTPILMKKGRPGHVLSVLCDHDLKDRLAEMIFLNGKTLGIRVGRIDRMKLPRKETTVTTSGGAVSVKIANFGGKQLIFPEYDDMAKAMEKAGAGYDDIYFEIQRALRKES